MSQEYRHIVRISGKDIKGSETLYHGLTHIKGVGQRLASAVIRKLGLDPFSRVGYLDEDTITKIEEIIKDPVSAGIPAWMVNRRRDMYTGKDIHLVGNDLIFRVNTDIENMKRMMSWKGMRHAWHLKVRGQRTRSTGRSGLTLGVVKKKKK